MRRAALTAFKAEDKEKKTSQPVMERINHLLTKYTQGREGEVAVSGRSVLDLATSQQKTLDLKLLPRGFIGKGWKDAMEEGGTEQPEHKMTHLQRILWSTVMVPIWNKRFKIQHGKDNQAEEANNLRLGDRIQCYGGSAPATRRADSTKATRSPDI